MADAQRMLLLMRHADAVTFAPGLGDSDRPLTAGGREQAARVGAYLKEHGITPDSVLSSSAARTCETGELLQLTAPVRHSAALYNAGSDIIREVIGEVADDERVLLVVGHAPGIPTLAHALVDEETTDPKVTGAIRWGFPTATLVGIEVGGLWSDLVPGRVVFTFRG